MGRIRGIDDRLPEFQWVLTLSEAGVTFEKALLTLSSAMRCDVDLGEDKNKEAATWGYFQDRDL